MAGRNETATATVLLNGKQAEEELNLLKKRSEALRKEMIELGKANDKAGFDRKERELKQVQTQMRQLQKETWDVTKVLKNLNGTNFNDLNRAQKQITAELKKMERGTDAYIAKNKQLQAVTAELSKVKTEMYGVQSAGKGFGSIANSFNKYFGVITAALATFTGMILGIRNAIDAFNEFESKVANLSAITGLAGADLDFLAQRAKELSTSTTDSGVKITSSADVIVDAFTKMGSARPELLKDKEAMALVTEQALILAEAGKIELDEAIQAVAATMNQFNLTANESARAINVLAAGSLEGSAEIADLTASMKNVGTVADASNMSLEQTVAALEVLAEKQLKGEEAGTMLRGSLIKLKEAGVGYQSGAFDLRDALEEVNAKMAGMSSQMEKDQLLIEMFGTRNITVGQILLNNVEKYDQLTDAVTGTNVATEQAVKNTDTNAARLEQARNKVKLMAIELGEKLAPAFTFSTNAVSYFLKALKASIDFYIEHRKTINTLAAAIVAYTAAVQIAKRWDNIHYTFLVVKEAILKIHAFTYQLLAGKINLATAATKAFQAVSTKTWWGIAAAILASIVAAIVQYTSKLKDVQVVNQELIDLQAKHAVSIEKETDSFERLFARIKESKPHSEERIRLVKELNEQYPGLIKNIDLESASLTELNNIYDDSIGRLKTRLQLQSKQKEAELLQSQIDDSRAELIKLDEGKVKWDEKVYNKLKIDIKTKEAELDAIIKSIDFMETESKFNTKVAELTAKRNKILEDIQLFGEEADYGNTTEGKAAWAINKAQIEALRIEYEKLGEEIKSAKKSAGFKPSGTPVTPPDDPTDPQKAADKALADLNKLREKAEDIRRQMTLDVMAQNNRELAVINDRWNNELLIVGLTDEKIAALNAKSYADMSALEKQQWDTYLVTEATRELELEAKRKEHQQKKLKAKEDFEQNKRSLELELMKEGMSDEDAEVYAAEQKYKKLIDQATKYGLDVTGIEDLMHAQLDAIREKWDAKRLADEKTLNDKLIADQRRIYDAKISIANSTANAIGSVMQIVGKKSQQDAEFYQALGLAQIAINTGVAVAGAIKVIASGSTSPYEMIAQIVIIAAEIIAAIASATSLVESAKIPSYAGGLYSLDTTGGRYTVRYGGEPVTQEVAHPTHFVAGEKRPEMIVDGATYRNLQINAPEVISAIYAHRTPAYASGMYPPVETRHALSQTETLILAELSRINATLAQKPAVEVRAKVVYQDIEDMDEAVTRNRNDWNA